jgi:rare lipoprotein A
MILRLAALIGLGLFGAVQATAAELLPLVLHAPAHQNYSAVGMASWYGADFHGHSTADGETFDMRSISAAHPTMPLPSYARVTNLHNGRSVIVRINDRGPFVGGRILDVSARVASLLEFSRLGVTKVKVDYIGKAPVAGSDATMLLASLQIGGAPAVVKPTLVAARAAPDAGGPSPLAMRLASDEGQTIIARAVERTRAIAFTSVAAHPASEAGDAILARVVEQPQAAEPRSPYGELVAYPFVVQAGPALRGTAAP